MPLETVFRCDSVQFSSGQAPPPASPETIISSSLADDHDQWSPAKVSLQDVGPNDRWLMIELEGSAASGPTVFRPIKGWMMSSDSVRFAMQLLLHAGPNSFPQGDLIVAMTGEEPGALTKTIQKLRFGRAQSEDYWVFLHKIATARLQECLAQQ